MKKILTSFLVGLCTLAASATDYTGTLTVNVNGALTTVPNQTISLTGQDGVYNLSILDFKLDASTAVGDIILENIPAVANEYGMVAMALNKNIQITSSNPDAIGPNLGDVPINMVTRFLGNYLLTDIDITMMVGTELQTIHVNFATADAEAVAKSLFQIPNGDFEGWKASSGEPDNWHGFKSAKGSLASMASSSVYKRTTENINSTEGRTTTIENFSVHGGTYCAAMKSTSIIGIVANGTMTNGQLNAESTTATDTANHSEMDKESTATDNNGDPFYTALNAKPDAIKAFVAFVQDSPNSSYPYATFSTILFDGSYYQDPEDKEYTNVAAKAFNKQIATTITKTSTTSGSLFNKKTTNTYSDTRWTELNLPFDYNTYANNNAAAAAILITASTNATPGKGSGGDILYVDDVSLVYNNVSISNIVMNDVTTNEGFSFDPAVHEYNLTYATAAQSVSENNFVVTNGGGVSGIVIKNVEDLGYGNYKVAIAVVRGDMAQYELYSINITRTLPLATAMEEGSAQPVHIAEPLYIAGYNLAVVGEDMVPEFIFTDGAGQWVSYIATSEEEMNNILSNAAIAAGSYCIVNNDAVNPSISFAGSYAFDNSVGFSDFATYDLASHFAPKANEVAYVTGYMDNEGKLRGWSGADNSLQGQSLDLDLSIYEGDTNFTKGQHMQFFGVFKLKEAWSGAPRRIAAGDDNYYDNYTLMVMDGGEIDETVTAISTVSGDKAVESVRYINVAGQTSVKPFDGLNIVVTRYSDGTTRAIKVVK